MTLRFTIDKKSIQKLNNNCIIIFFTIFLFNIIFTGNLIAQFAQERDPRFILQEDREMEKAKQFHVKTRTAVNQYYGGFGKSSPEGVVNEYIIYNQNGYKIEHTTFRAGSFVDTKWIYEYDENGNIVSLQGIDNLGKLQYKRDSKYDEFNKEIERIEYKHNTRETYKGIYIYDETGKLIRVDTYNSKGQKIWSEEYTFEGKRLIEQKSYNQSNEIASIIKYKHNNADLIIEEIAVVPSSGESTTIATYKYDSAGRVLENKTDNFRQTFEYNANGDVVLDIMYNMYETRQHKFTIAYDDKGLMIERIRYSPADKKVYSVKYEYEYF